MTRTQLRPFYSEAERAQVYGRSYDHTRWGDHIERVAVTAGLVAGAVNRFRLTSVADLSCGDGAIVQLARRTALTGRAVLGDLVKRPGLDIAGPIEETILQLMPVDLYVCSETLEHVEDPDELLRRVRDKARFLVLSTPDGETGSDNPEHYWGWDRDDVRAMLQAAGWNPQSMLTLRSEPSYYTFQIWLAERS
jgi:2-polyprenyl-3-methyl-5-hydroxy-6-metoxy-1,4-benzoquinol methylase